MESSYFFPILGFLSGSVPFSYLAGRFLAGKDVRREGSGNVGATNVFRVAGRKAGVAAAAGDVLKSLLPVLCARLLAARHPEQFPSWVLAATGAGVMLGHCYSPFLRFRGGKGVISFIAVFAVLSFPAAIVFGVVWLATFFFTGYVSLASILGAGALAGAMALLGADRALVIFAVLAAAFVVFKHRENIRRLRGGTESRMRGARG
jgi:glycerol-3-phosphate acyltransferase PlsY